MRGDGVPTGVFVALISRGIGMSLGVSGRYPLVDLISRGRGIDARRSASSGVNSGASLIAFDMFTSSNLYNRKIFVSIFLQNLKSTGKIGVAPVVCVFEDFFFIFLGTFWKMFTCEPARRPQ